MMKILWVTDIHLNFLKRQAINAFCQDINAHEPDMLLLGGDIAEAPTVARYLMLMNEQLQCPIYFVLGNHDYYHGGIESTRSEIRQLELQSPGLRYLPLTGIVRLNETTALIGHDSWADGRYGDYRNSDVMLNDYRLIAELRGLDSDDRLIRLNALGDAAAAYFKQQLSEALKHYRHVIALTHVPPFTEAAWHEGHQSNDNFAPHFSCQAVGAVFLELMQQHPECFLTVLCGHTHGNGVCQKLPNLQVRTGAAEYRHPQIQDPIFIE